MWVVAVPDAAIPDVIDPAVLRRHQRSARQARVGLLRNPNRPPRPPPRRAPLMGKWLDLRSSRRLSHEQTSLIIADQPGAESQFEHAEVQITEAITRDQSGQVASINVDHLMRAVDGVGGGKPVRTPYGVGYRADMNLGGKTVTTPQKTSVLSAQAWPEEPEADPVEEAYRPAPIRHRRRSRPLRALAIILGGVAMAITVLLILPDVSPIQPSLLP